MAYFALIYTQNSLRNNIVIIMSTLRRFNALIAPERGASVMDVG